MYIKCKAILGLDLGPILQNVIIYMQKSQVWKKIWNLKQFLILSSLDKRYSTYKCTHMHTHSSKLKPDLHNDATE